MGFIPSHSTPSGNKVITSQSFFVTKLTALDGVGVFVGVAVGVLVSVGVGVFDAVTVGVTVGVGVLVGVAHRVDAGTLSGKIPANGCE